MELFGINIIILLINFFQLIFTNKKGLTVMTKNKDNNFHTLWKRKHVQTTWKTIYKRGK